MPHSRACVCCFYILGLASGQESATSRVSRTVATGSVPISHSPGDRVNVDPVVLNRATLEEKVITLRLVPKMATSIRMPEPVNSVVLGDPDNFLAEHSEHEPEMVTVKPVNSEPAQTNLLITTTRGHQLNLLLVSNGENAAVQQQVDVFLKFGKPSATSFLVEEDPQPSLLIAETPPQVQLGGKIKKKWTTAEQLTVTDFRLSTRRLGAGQRADGVVIFERPSFKQSSETLFLQVADSGAVDKPALAPIGFGISSFRGGSAYGTGRNGSNQ